jgi:hypothetical protein
MEAEREKEGELRLHDGVISHAKTDPTIRVAEAG